MPEAAPIQRARSVSPPASRPLSVALLVGSLAPDGAAAAHCGVRDYAVRLAEALCDAGVAARVVAPPRWRLRDAVTFLRAQRGQQLDVIHLQYPSIGHRHSMLPHLLGLAGAARRCVVTLHEHSALPFIQRAADQLFRLTADQLIFTTDYEARAFGAASRAPIIPVGSSVPPYPGVPDRDDTVLYFGQIRPGKGIEDFLALATFAEASGVPARFVILGSTPPRWTDYGNGLRAQMRPNVAWVDNAPFTGVAESMATSMAAYLPFPDGASLRRSSLIAALSNGLPVIAPFGAGTTESLRAVLLRADTPEAALSQLRALRANSSLTRQCYTTGTALARQFGWESIAEHHLALYRRALGHGAELASEHPGAGHADAVSASGSTSPYASFGQA
jgi:glycosyltransferase involved in cell wall biosynthesis